MSETQFYSFRYNLSHDNQKSLIPRVQVLTKVLVLESVSSPYVNPNLLDPIEVGQCNPLMTVYNEFYFYPNTWTGLKCHLDEKIVYPILILVNYNYEIKKERSFSISYPVLEIVYLGFSHMQIMTYVVVCSHSLK